MKIVSKTLTAAALLLVILLVTPSRTARAGWSVNVDATGRGTVTVKVTSPSGVSNVVKTAFMVNPSATINKQSNQVFAATGTLPAGANKGTYVQVRASAGYVTSIQSKTSGGDLNDSENEELLQYVIPKLACSTSDFEVVPLQATSNAVTFHYKATLSDEGSAVLLRVLEATTGQPKYTVVLTGPLSNEEETEEDGRCEGTFTVKTEPTGDEQPPEFVVLVDGTSATLPFSIDCPADQVISCSTPNSETYDPPAVVNGVTGPFTVTYDPPANELVPGVTNLVTVTATDTNGCTTQCQFNVYRQAIQFIGFLSPLPFAGANGGSCASPIRVPQVGGILPIKFKMSCGRDLLLNSTPTVKVEKALPGCSGVTAVASGQAVFFQNNWQYNLNTAGLTAGIYKITACLPDGSQHTVWINLSN